MSSPFTLENKSILITGASSGLGRAIAIGCSQMGANVICVGRDKDRLHQTRTSMHEGSHQIIKADLTVSKERDHIVAELNHPLAGIVHCAGISRLSPVRLMTEDHLQELNQINVYAPMLLTQALLKTQKIQTGGSILFISSIAAHIGVAGVAAYSGTKSSLIAMARCLAMEVVKRKIRVNTLSPALVETPLLEATAQLTGSLDMERNNYPLGFGKAEDIANAAIFFLSDASRWITGSDLIMDGGLTIS